MKKREINSKQYIENIIHKKDVKEYIFDQQYKLINSIKLGFKTIFFGKKWLIYLVLAFTNLFFIIMIEGVDAQFENPEISFINTVFDWLFPFIFVFGCLLLSLPLSVDEISDHILDLYLVRPIKREIYWLSRWIVINIVVFSLNVVIYFIYFLYFHAFASGGLFTGFISNLEVFSKIVILLIAATLIYSGTFLLIGMIGNRGLLISFMFAILDVFIIRTFLLTDNPFIPQTNLNVIANDLLSDYDYIEFEIVESLTVLNAWLYSYFFSITIFICGAYYLRIREIN